MHSTLKTLAVALVAGTFAIGAAVNTAVKESVVPDSDTASVVLLRAKSAMSPLSVVVTVTVWSEAASKWSSELASSTLTVTSVVWLPSWVVTMAPSGAAWVFPDR